MKKHHSLSLSLHLSISVRVPERKKYEDVGEVSGVRVTSVRMKNETQLHLRAACLMFADESHCPNMSVSESIFSHEQRVARDSGVAAL